MVVGEICYSDRNGKCSGTAYKIEDPINMCEVDICFAVDQSGSIRDTPRAWDIQVNVVDSITKSIGATPLISVEKS